MEVLQLVGADHRLGALRRLAVSLLPGTSSGLIGVSSTSCKHGAHLRAELIGARHPADQILDQRLRHAGVDVVVRHVIAHAVGAPAQRQLGQIAGADHQRVVQVGQAEQMAGALAGLHVLERDVVHRLALREGMADVLEHLHAARPDVDLVARSQPTALISRRAWSSVRSLVAKPGMV